jgi:hypothetical protein
LLDRRHFAQRPAYFAPFDADVARAFEAGRRAGFAALALAEGARVTEVGDFALVELAGL